MKQISYTIAISALLFFSCSKMNKRYLAGYWTPDVFEDENIQPRRTALHFFRPDNPHSDRRSGLSPQFCDVWVHWAKSKRKVDAKVVKIGLICHFVFSRFISDRSFDCKAFGESSLACVWLQTHFVE
jgi:hypothetical protein